MSPKPSVSVNAKALLDWLVNYISTRCDIPVSELQTDIPFEEFGIDSMQAVEITAQIEQQFHISVEPTALFEFNTVSLLVSHLAPCDQSAQTQ